MPVYKYKAISPDGQAVESTTTAKSKEEVINILRQNRQIPVYVVEHIEGKDVKTLDLFNKVRIKDIAVFCRQFYAMLNAGVTIINCLDILRQQIENRRLRTVTGDVYEDVQKGLTFSEALKKHEDVFPELLVNMVAAGEASGNLDTIMDRMALHYEKENKINTKIRSAMIYPMLLSIMAVLVVVFLLTFIMPKFVGMFTDSGVPLPLPTRIVLGISHGIIEYWYIVIAVIAVAAYVIKRASKLDSVRIYVDSLKFRLPVIKSSTQKIVTSRFSRTMSTLLASGMPLLQSLDIVSKIVGNKVVEEGILTAKDEVRKGMSLSGPIKKIGVFPPMLVSMLSIGEESGSLDEILDRTANYYDDEVEASLEATTKLVEPLMLVVIAVLVGFIVVAMIMPMFDMMKTIQV